MTIIKQRVNTTQNNRQHTGINFNQPTYHIIIRYAKQIIATNKIMTWLLINKQNKTNKFLNTIRYLFHPTWLPHWY